MKYFNSHGERNFAADGVSGKIAASGKQKVKWKSTLNVQIKTASTKRENCTRKRNYADARKFRKKNHNLTVVYVQRLCYQDTKTCFKMHSIYYCERW